MKSSQQSLFDTNPAPWEADDECQRLMATVVFATGPPRPFDYAVPDHLRDAIAPGQRVRAPFGKGDRLVTGYCVRLETATVSGRTLKPLEAVIDRRALLSPAMLRLTAWMADYYLCPWGQVLEAVVPAGVRQQAGTRTAQFAIVANQVVARLTQLKLTPTQRRILEFIAAHPAGMPVAQVAKAVGCTTAPLATLRRKGLLTLEARRHDASAVPPQQLSPSETHLTMNDDQQRALAAILAALAGMAHRTVLIHGVTGSGKTEVYMQAIAEVIGFGRQAIVLVPEISLTPQTVSRFRSRFGNVAVLHSHQSDVERRRQWDRIAEGEISVIVGARSAVFAPTPNLGLIILDEEHEGSFKQDTAPRYHARDVALERARDERVPLVLGSATPSLESWRRAHQGQYELLSMPRRVFDRPLPAVGTIDLRVEFQDRRSRGAISRQLHQAIVGALEANGQVILLLNRRGYSTHIQCSSCGKVVECPDCAIALTHHLESQTAICHYCDFHIAAPDKCPACGFEGIRYSGLGTQRLEAEVKARFPGHRCLRMDTDTMRKPGSHEKALDRFRAGEVQILLGTQMIAKGLDFPNVTLVGVINADTALHLPDFRAAERTFQLVTQVAGRTGRGEKGGRVLVQTFSPEHSAIAAAVEHDYQAFAQVELPIRESLGYPPFGSMIRLVVRGASEPLVAEMAEAMASGLRAEMKTAEFAWRVLGPAPAPIPRLRGQFRYQVQLQGADAAALRDAVRAATAGLKLPEGVQWMADVDPLDML